MTMMRQKATPRSFSKASLSTLGMALLLAGSHAMATEKMPRVVGGDSADADQFPWQAAIIFDSADPYNSLHCGGSIINERWILTAAHCSNDGAGYVVVGTQDLEDTTTAQIIEIEQWHPHPDYVDEGETDPSKVIFDNDIALIELATPIDLDACGSHCALIEPVTDNNESNVMGLSSDAYVSGWGETIGSASELSYYPPDLQWATLKIVSCNDSPSLYADNEITSNMFCAGVSNFTKDSCSGDSGGPLVVSNQSGTGHVQAGVVSWGNGCAINGYPGVYTRLSQYEDWIKSTTDGACCDSTDTGTDPDSTPNSGGGGGGGGGGGSLSWLMLFTLPALTLRRRSKARISA